MGLEKQV
jgi:hypothetical protein